ncbi:aminomethyl-transferring glycine dehydrogenase subunit GcvPB [Myxococcota bacterium]|nr:aminomethyl-transferring glycine dehydrogenase subunit GcvPB [Myxococcota bacterium]
MTSKTNRTRIDTVGNATRGIGYEEPLLFEIGSPNRKGTQLPISTTPEYNAEDEFSGESLRDELSELPELSEVDVVRHFTRLSTWNAAVDLGLYPLGSCTMKYNPKINELVARLSGFSRGHPMQPEQVSQGFLRLCWELETFLREISGMTGISLQPSAGAQGELAGIMMIRAYHESRQDPRREILVPDSAHGTNPASASLNGYKVIAVPSGKDGILHPETIKPLLNAETAGLMITNPNTLGLFETNIQEITSLVHEAGGLVYGDGANLNALLGVSRPGDCGIDVMHFNLHKTFSTPHGGGGPGAGPVGVADMLIPFLPTPIIIKNTEGFFELSHDAPLSIGRLHGFFGNAGMLIRAYAYIKSLGANGLKHCTEMAVLNANYLLKRLSPHYHVPYESSVMHECVLSDKGLEETGVTTLDIAKRLIDHGYHPPTIYFPLVVSGAIMIEPTESESLEGLDRFADALIAVREEAIEEPDILLTAPHHTRHNRLDETRAARNPILRFAKEDSGP